MLKFRLVTKSAKLSRNLELCRRTKVTIRSDKDRDVCYMPPLLISYLRCFVQVNIKKDLRFGGLSYVLHKRDFASCIKCQHIVVLHIVFPFHSYNNFNSPLLLDHLPIFLKVTNDYSKFNSNLFGLKSPF